MEDNEWEMQRSEIESLYIRQNRSLKDVMEILRTRRNFHKSKKQYENAFKAWGFEKYKLNTAKLKVINRKIAKRKQNSGRESEVYINGIHYPASKLQTAISRRGFVSTSEMFSVPSPQTPEGIMICTPLPVDVSQWFPTLPWFQFLRWVSRQESKISLSRLSSSVLPIDCNRHPLATHDIIQSLRSFFPHNRSQQQTNIEERVQLHKLLRLLVPEAKHEEHSITSRVLCNGEGGTGLEERFKLLFFLLSNSFSLIQRDGIDFEKFGMMGYLDKGHTKEEDELILNILRSSGLNTSENMKHLFAMPGLSPGVIAEKLFGSAVRSSDTEILTNMLSAGMDPQTLVMSENGVSATPLEYFCEKSASLDMVNILLAYGADVNEYQHCPVLATAMYSQNSDMVSTLLFQGASIYVCLKELDSSQGTEKLEGQDLTPLRQFLDYIPVQNEDIKDNEDTLAMMLGLSIKARNLELVNAVISWGANVNSLHNMTAGTYIDLYQTTTLGIAVECGEMSIISALYLANAAVNPSRAANVNIIHPLTIAVAQCHFDATVFLISCGGDVNISDNFRKTKKSLFDRALDHGDLRICDALLSAGARAEENSLQYFYNQRILSFVNEHDVHSILELPLHQIDMDYIRNDKQKTALGRAIEVGNLSVIKALFVAGARHMGKNVIKIGGIQTAEYLKFVGVLPRLMASSGRDILVAAIRGDDDALVEFLLYSSEGLADILPKQQFWWKETPVEAAINRGRMAALEALMDNGVRITDEELAVAVQRALATGDDSFLMRTMDDTSLIPAPKAFSLAVRENNPELFELLLNHGLDPRDDRSPNSPGTVLELAATMDDENMFGTVLDSVPWSEKSLGCALTATVWSRKRHRMQYLHDAGAYLDQATWQNDRLFFPIQIAVKMNDIALVKQLIDYGCDPDKSERSVDMRRPLQIAVGDGNIEIVNLLLDAGADVDGQPVYHGTTPLQIAVKRGNMELVERLLEAGADVNSAPAPRGGATALQFAAIRGFLGIARKLLEKGADVNAGRALSSGRTALEGAAENGRLDMVQFLLDHGALLEGRGRRQYIKAVTFAECNAHSAIARFLRSYGGWTELDSQTHYLDASGEHHYSELDPETDLTWEYDFPKHVVHKLNRRPLREATSR